MSRFYIAMNHRDGRINNWVDLFNLTIAETVIFSYNQYRFYSTQRAFFNVHFTCISEFPVRLFIRNKIKFVKQDVKDNQ